MNRMFHNNIGNDAPRSSPPFQQPMHNPHPQEQQRAFQGNRQHHNMFMGRGGFPPNQNQGQNMFSLNQRQMRPPIQRGQMQQQQSPNQNMFTPNQIQTPHPMQRAPMQQQAMPQNMPFAQQPYMEQPKEKSGLLSKLFRKSGKNNANPQANMRSGSPFAMPMSSARSTVAATSAASAASSGGFLQSILDPSNLTGMLNNTQRVLQAAESFTPLVQQYGPLVKNIPAMWKLFKGLNAEDSTDEQQPETKAPEQVNTQEQTLQQEPTIPAEEPSEKKKVTVHNHSTMKPHIKPKQQSPTPTSSSRRQYREGESKPKLFM